MDNDLDLMDILDTGSELTDLIGSAKGLETADMPSGRRHVTRTKKAEFRHISRRNKAQDLMDNTELPQPGEVYHYISDARYDFFNVIVATVNKIQPVHEFYGSTWTMNRYNVLDLLGLLDKGYIEKAAILTGTYFKRRESSVYAQLVTGLAKRGQRFNAFINHTKIVLLKTETDYIVFEGSANFTANPRLENYIICNDQGLYDFHRSWMEEMLAQ